MRSSPRRLAGLEPRAGFEARGALSYITKSETPGTVSLQPMATSATGMAAASATFTVNGSPVGYDRIELTGSSPLHPPGIPFGFPEVYDSDTILELDRLPGTLGVLGAGVIGSEYAPHDTAPAQKFP